MSNQAKDPVITLDDLPISFQVKYLGQHSSRGLWGIKHTRAPVDYLVQTAKSFPCDIILPPVQIIVRKSGVQLVKTTCDDVTTFPIENISYGVQDLVYTRVFCMIVVNERADVKVRSPFDCHAFVCESRDAARKLTYALAAAFHEYSVNVQERDVDRGRDVDRCELNRKKFAIDLRTPEEMREDMERETEA